MSFKPPIGDASTTKKGLVQLSGDLGGTASAPTVTGLSAKADSASAQIIVRWNAGTGQWGARPVGAPFGILFLSTNDPAAPAPSGGTLMTGDVWRRHPDAV